MAGSMNIHQAYATGDNKIDGLLFRYAWGTAIGQNITYSFPDSPTDFSYAPQDAMPGQPDPTDYVDGAYVVRTSVFNSSMSVLEKDFGTAYDDMLSVEGFVASTFSAGTHTTAMVRIVESDSMDGFPSAPGLAGNGEYPGNAPWSGDVTLRNRDLLALQDRGSKGFHVVAHEIGHALGLKHPQDTEPNHGSEMMPELAKAYQGLEFTVMSTTSKNGNNDWAEVANGNLPQTFMMLDIAALQHMYGANYQTNSGNNVYTWNPNNGNALIDGNLYLSVADTPVIFQTIWDGGGTDKYDFSNYDVNIDIDLAPGGHTRLGLSQRANLAWTANGEAPRYPDGNIYNALMYQGNIASLIENAAAGSGNDKVFGNQVNNVLSGNYGNDVLRGREGNDTLFGNAHHDQLFGGIGNDILNGGNGSDTMHFSESEAGHDIVTGFDDGLDVLHFHSFQFLSKADIIAAAVQVGSDVVITWNNGQNTVTIEDFNKSNLNASDLVQSYDLL